MSHPTFLSVAVLAATLIGCGSTTDPDEIPSGTATGSLDILLDATPDTNDAPIAGVEEVWVRFEDVRVRSEAEGWLTIGDDRRDIDLMELRGGSAMSIGSDDVFEGSYDAVSLVIADSWIIVDGEQWELAIERGPGVAGSGDAIQFNVDYWVDENTNTSVRIEWDLDTELSGSDQAWTLRSTVDIDVSLD